MNFVFDLFNDFFNIVIRASIDNTNFVFINFVFKITEGITRFKIKVSSSSSSSSSSNSHYASFLRNICASLARARCHVAFSLVNLV